MNERISIIIPMYNARNYVEDCLRSVQAQTYPFFECIIVDDESQDGSLEIAQQWAEKDPRFRVLCQKHAGVSYAISNGVRAADGTWLYFLDSDDWIDPDELERLYHEVKTHRCDMVVSDYLLETDKTERRRVIRFQGVVERAEYRQKLYDQFLCNEYHNEIVCGNSRVGKLVKRELAVNNLALQEGMVFAEDAILMLGVLCDCDRVCTQLSKAGYHYRIHNGSSTHKYGLAYVGHKKTYIERAWNVYREKGMDEDPALLSNYRKFVLYSIIGGLKAIDFQMEALKAEDSDTYQWIMDKTRELSDHSVQNTGWKNKMVVYCLVHRAYGLLSMLYSINHFITKKLKR